MSDPARYGADAPDEPVATEGVPGWREELGRFGRDWAVVVALGAIALLGFMKVGEDVFAHESGTFDGTVQAWMLGHQHALADRAFYWITVVGGVSGMCVLALAGAAWFWARRRRAVSATVMVTPVVAVTIFNIIKRIYARPRPLGLGGRVDSSYSFPSGHATASAAVCCTLAYVLWREGFIRRNPALALASIPPVLVGLSRLYLNVHWTTDVLGGWCAGVMIAVLSATLYNRYHLESARHSSSPLTVSPSSSRTSAP